MTTSPSLPGRHIDANGIRLYVNEYGEGVPVILLQGGLVSSMMWDPAIPHLAPHCHLVTFDYRGHGHSTNPSGELSYERFAEDTAALIAALELDRPFVGGWSSGGEVALEFGLRYPQLTRGLLVGGAMTDYQTERANGMLRDLLVVPAGSSSIDFDRFEQQKPELARFFRSMHPGEEQWKHIAQETTTMLLAYPGFTKEQVQQVATPSIVIQGDRDDLVPITEALKLYEWLPSAELAVIPGGSHGLFFDRAELFCAIVLDFVGRHAN